MAVPLAGIFNHVALYPLHWDKPAFLFPIINRNTIQVMKKRLRIHDLILLIMRITFYQLLFTSLFSTIAFASKSDAQGVLSQKISLDVKQQTVDKVLSQIEQLVDVKFLYSSSLISSSRQVYVQVKDETLASVLDRLLAPLNLNYQVSGRQIVLNRLQSPA
jgi:hypothetical protein